MISPLLLHIFYSENTTDYFNLLVYILAGIYHVSGKRNFITLEDMLYRPHYSLQSLAKRQNENTY